MQPITTPFSNAPSRGPVIKGRSCRSAVATLLPKMSACWSEGLGWVLQTCHHPDPASGRGTILGLYSKADLRRTNPDH